MASSTERSPPPFPDTEDQDVLDSEEVGGRDSDDDDGEELFMSASNTPLTKQDTPASPDSQASDLMDDLSAEPPSSQTEKSAASSSPEEFVDLTNNLESAESKVEAEISSPEPSDDFFDILGSETQKVEVEASVKADSGEVSSGVTDLPGGKTGSEQGTSSAAPIINLNADFSDNNQQPSRVENKTNDPLAQVLSDTPAADPKKPSSAVLDLFEDDGSDIFTGTPQTKPASQPQKGLFGEPDEDLFGEPLGAMSKKTTENEVKSSTTKAAGPASSTGGAQQDRKSTEPADIFTEEAVTTVPRTSNTSTVNSKANGVHSEEDLFTEATVELSLDSPRSGRKKEETSKPSASSSSSSLSAPAKQAKQPPAALEELEDEEEAEKEDQFDVFISVKDPEKVGDGMNAYMAYKVSTETSLPMFRNKLMTVRRRFSDFLGLYEKLSEKHGPNGLIVPPPPEKSILGMTKVKVGKEDSSSADFLERRRGALERYLQRVVNHPMLLQDPDVREFLEKEELPRAVSTQALSGAGFLKMINKATDAVNKMTIKMNESDAWFEEKLQEVESADQHFRKLHALVESLVVHRKELSLNTANFAKSAAMLGSAEDNTALSRALSQLAEVEDKIEQLHQDQAANDTFSFAELIADYIRLLGAVRGSFDHRIKAWQRWQDGQAMLQKKRETEAKLLWANKPDKLQQAKDEIVEWEAKVTQFERDFERVSATVRKEVIRFEKQRTNNFRRQITKYLESLLQSQQQLIKYWEAFLPEAKAIA
ncbi:sorting nexin-1 isoform X1 [Oryzias melastigma]|uniref:Sorting nexin-1 n=2 Tax=Oryzias melastigma TaxID=30732 RepID=A0A3B3BF45_ORYME|nr:sorting nexin-1 isoform X1 [Oryzias melastigma]